MPVQTIEERRGHSVRTFRSNATSKEAVSAQDLRIDGNLLIGKDQYSVAGFIFVIRASANVSQVSLFT